MEGEIVNRVANSQLQTLDLEQWYTPGARFGIDISQWLDEGLILREKTFRETLAAHHWDQYAHGYVSLYCTTDAIVPAWAYMLVSSYLTSVAKGVVAGPPEMLETVLFRDRMAELDWEQYRDKPVIIKGCGKVPVPPSAYIWALQRVQGLARLVLYGEACSSVPLFRRK